MKNIWITYAQVDNQQGDIDYIAQELEQVGVKIKLDRWNIVAGKRLWQQIEKFICSPEECDAWILIATDNSLSSESCKEEFAYALDRVLKQRGEKFPVIGLFLNSVNEALIPAAIRIRLYISITEPDWKENIIAATEGKQLDTVRKNIEPFYLKIHKDQEGNEPIAIEVRPRAGVWNPFFAGIMASEKDIVDPNIMLGPCDYPMKNGVLMNYSTGLVSNSSELVHCDQIYIMYVGMEATPTKSYYIWCKIIPSLLIFGNRNSISQSYIVDLSKKK
jgi:hypothetical protein